MQANTPSLAIVPLRVDTPPPLSAQSGVTSQLTQRRVASLAELVNSIIHESDFEFAILHRPEVFIDQGLLSSTHELINELGSLYPNWGVCGASGTRWDSEHDYWYVRRPPENPATGLSPRLATMVGSEIVLLNIRRLREKGCSLPNEQIKWYEVGPLLTIESLRTHSVALVDRRLFIVDTGSPADFADTSSFERHYSRYFFDHIVRLPEALIDIPEVQFDHYLALPPMPHEKRDILGCFDAALAEARSTRGLSITIACRSQLNRPHLLERALLSFASASVEAPSWLSIHVVIVSGQEGDRLLSEVDAARQRFPGLSIEGLHVRARDAQTSRIDNIIAAIQHARGDYIWFIDDDDFVMPGAIPALARSLAPEAPLLCVGQCDVFDEVWDGHSLIGSTQLPSFPGRQVFRVFQGENFVPICGMVIPCELAKSRLQGLKASGEYLEDYFLLLRLLTSSHVEVEILPQSLAGISLRGQENTVRETNRERWNRSYAEFIGEILRDKEACNPLLWQLAQER